MVLEGTSLVVESERVILRLSLSALEIGSECWNEKRRLCNEYTYLV